MGHTYRGGKSGCKVVTLFDSYCYDGVSVVIGVHHTEMAENSCFLADFFLSGIWGYSRPLNGKNRLSSI